MGDEVLIVITTLPNSHLVSEVLFSKDGIARNLKPGSMVAYMSLATPARTVEAADSFRLCIACADAPLSSGGL
ncbi:NAD(P)-binding domain-containing protein [Paraburkholderia caribensis]|uniref:NAD(P)-binding domain-containing protein n=1 Tax=Paraburkholderia caribensis TaxID=75105 RepID=UPI000AC9AE92|nr:NAD(P)-binding domain-containing protein [Paraburkholderia caribensis]